MSGAVAENKVKATARKARSAKASRVPMNGERLKVLELFCGIGGCAAALDDRVDIVAAVDISETALAVYRQNFSHQTFARTIESISAQQFCQWDADLWWLSPPCQPFTRRGKQRDLADPRCAGFSNVVENLRAARPRYLALENVPEFYGSAAYWLLRERLALFGYGIHETLLCPTELGIPNRRRRFYLVASQNKLLPPQPVAGRGMQLPDFLEAAVDRRFYQPSDLAKQYKDVWHVVDSQDAGAIANCFTAAYGRSLVRSGSYVADGSRIRRFTPREILRCLAFRDSFRFPSEVNDRRAYRLVGNSLSVAATRNVLSVIPELAV